MSTNLSTQDNSVRYQSAQHQSELYQRIKKVFDSRYIHYQDVLDALWNGWVNMDSTDQLRIVLLWGRGGYGKSSMAWDFAKEVFSGDLTKIFLQSFGASTTEDKLWGGIDLRSLRDEDSIRFRLQNSWLANKLPIMEELFDLPGSLRDDLKDSISRGFFLRGDEMFKSKVNCMIICTNHDPSIIEKQSNSADAFIQRCDLELKVEWPTHEVRDYKLMLEKQRPEQKSIAPIIANLISCCQNKGKLPIPPRLAVKALDTVVRQANAKGRSYVIDEDLLGLRFSKPFCRNVSLLKESIPSALSSFGGFLVFNKLKSRVDEIGSRMEVGISNLKLKETQEFAGELSRIQEELKKLLLPSEGEGHTMRQELAKKVSSILHKI